MNTSPRSPVRLGQPVVDPAGWTSPDLDSDLSWMHHLTPAEIDALKSMAAAVRPRLGEDPDGLLSLGKDDFDLGAFAPTLQKVWHDLKDGRGLALLRGLPIHEMDLLDVATIYWGIGRHLGTARSNNPEGDMLGHVTDLGKTQDDPDSRGYQTREAMDYHCDQASIVGLICIREPRSGGMSKVASSISVYNELLRRSPQAVELLSRPVYWTKHGEVDEGQDPFYQSPVFAALDGMLCTSFGPKHIVKGHALPGAPRMTDELLGAIGLAESLAEEQHYAMTLQQGDIQLLNNFVCLHTRTAYADWPEPERKRLLWRLWLSAPDLRPATAYVEQWDAGVNLERTRNRIVL